MKTRAAIYAKSVVSTSIAIAICMAAGAWAAYRSHSLRASVAAGLRVCGLSALIVTGVSVATLAIWHDQHTMTMIRASGGVGETLVLPILLVAPGTAGALFGGAISTPLTT